MTIKWFVERRFSLGPNDVLGDANHKGIQPQVLMNKLIPLIKISKWLINFKVYAPSLLYEAVKNCQILLSLFYPRWRFFVKNYWKSKILTTFWGDVDIDSISKLESLCSSD